MAVTTNTDKLSDKVVEDLAKLLERTGMGVSQENGQRRLGPPRDHNGDPPPKGSEVFVGKLPRDCFEPELVETFEKVGKIYEIRLMMDFNGANRGFCFIQFYTAEAAQRAIKELNNFEIRKGRFIGVVKSVDNCRLFVGGIPTDKSEQDILEEISKVTDGVVRVIMYPSAADKTKNRGFSFVEYSSHKVAAVARRKMIPGKILMWGVEVAVDWAEPEPDVDSEVMSKVQVLYVRNLMLTTTEEHLQELFNAHSNNSVEKVKKLKDFAFVHFNSREEAEKAKLELNDTEIDGSRVEITWAKPVDKTVYKAQKALSQTLYPSGGRGGSRGSSRSPSSSNASSPSQYGGQYPGNYSGHGLMPIPPGYQNMMTQAAYLNYAANFEANMRTQRMLATRFHRGRAAAGVQGIRLPAQSLFQQPQHNAPRNMVPYFGAHMYHPDQYYYAYHHQYPQQQPHGHQVLTTTAAPDASKKTPQDLLELCSQNRWGEPIYSQSTYKDGANNIYYGFTVTIPRHAPFGTKEYRGEHYCQDAEEGRTLAADGMYRALQTEIQSAFANPPTAPQKFHYTAFGI